MADINKLKATGSSIVVTGLIKAHLKIEGDIEMLASHVPFSGECDAGKYPLGKARLSLEHLRNIAHLRARSNIISSIARVRNALAFATHK